MKTPAILCTDGRETRFCIGAGPDDPDACDALAINPLAPPEILFSAAADRVDRIKSLARPLSFLLGSDADPIPSDALTGFVTALAVLADEAAQLLDYATTLQHQVKRGEA